MPTAIKEKWSQIFADLPQGLTTKEIVGRLKRPLRTIQHWCSRLGYKAADPKGWFTRRRKYRKHRRWERVDWSKSNIAIARELRLSREAVRQMRKKLDGG